MSEFMLTGTPETPKKSPNRIGMSDQLKALAALDRNIERAVSQGPTLDDKIMLIDFAERKLAMLKLTLKADNE